MDEEVGVVKLKPHPCPPRCGDLLVLGTCGSALGRPLPGALLPISFPLWFGGANDMSSGVELNTQSCGSEDLLLKTGRKLPFAFRFKGCKYFRNSNWTLTGLCPLRGCVCWC